MAYIQRSNGKMNGSTKGGASKGSGKVKEALSHYNFAGDIGKTLIPGLIGLLLAIASWQTGALMIGALGVSAALLLWWLIPRDSQFAAARKNKGSNAEGAARGGAVEGYLNDEGLGIVEALAEIAAGHDAAVASVALAWLRSKPEVAAPIASARTVEQLPDLLAGARLELTADEVAALDAASAGF